MDETVDNDYEQLLLLKGMTAVTGILHEAQVMQLKYWPLMLTHAIKADFSYNFDNKEVIFNLAETEGRTPKDFKKKLGLLAKYTKTLLGDDYRIAVKLNNKEIYSNKGVKNARREKPVKSRSIRSRKGKL